MDPITMLGLSLGLLILSTGRFAEGKTVRGVVSTHSSQASHTQYITRFCFHGETAMVRYELNTTLVGGRLYFFLDSRWENTQQTDNCIEKLGKAKFSVPLNGTEGNHTIPHFITSQIWHVTYGDLLTCNINKPMAHHNYATYKLEFFNPDVEGNPMDHFSDEETGLLGFYQLLTMLYFVLGCICFSSLYETLAKRGPMHEVLSILTTVLILQALCSVCMFIHLYSYSRDGEGTPFIESIGQLLDIAAQFNMLYLLLSLSVGWTLGNFKTNLNSQVWKSSTLSRVLALLAITQGVLVIMDQMWYAEHSFYHTHQDLTGVLLIVIRIVLAILFSGNLYQTVSKERSAMKRNFYISFCKYCLVWFLIYPLLIVTSFVFAEHIRNKFITIGVVSSQSLAVLLLYRLFLSRSLYWEISSLSSATLPLRMDKSFGIKLYSK
ncbi:integral membrane protein GPR180-like [Anneissia japonica]|uniref:integral membrane protein GPR180-like n=1 Tax=Anneissia japonica TaxID=1529436 RepID=UPI0014258C35|nr:integral membrane protein GPR180-like [Anneissia japonica]